MTILQLYFNPYQYFLVNSMGMKSMAGSVWMFQFRFDSVSNLQYLVSVFFWFRYLHTNAMQEYPSV